MVLASNDFVFIHFYNDNRYFKMLQPIWDDVADEISKAGYENGEVVIGKVDCETELPILIRFRVINPPRFKLFLNGLPRKNYRGQHTVDAFVDYIKKQMTDPVVQFNSLTELRDLSEDKKHLIGYIDRKDQPEYQIFRKVAVILKDECIFHAGFGDASAEMHPPGQPVIVFRTSKKTSTEPEETFNGSLTNFDALYEWARQKCIPLVREVTLENLDDLEEERLPLFMLYHHPTDTESVKRYKEVISREFKTERKKVNFVTVDGVTFGAFQRFGKSLSDLPLIAIDDSGRVYFFSDYKDMEKPGKLMQFLYDLYSGKLHRFQQLESRHNAYFKAFVVRVPTCKLDTFMKEDFWPKGVVYRRFRGRVPSPDTPTIK